MLYRVIHEYTDAFHCNADSVVGCMVNSALMRNSDVFKLSAGKAERNKKC